MPYTLGGQLQHALNGAVGHAVAAAAALDPASLVVVVGRGRDAVADYLVTRDVTRNRMFVQGVAYDSPIADNGSASGRAQNRRVELYILPRTS